MRNSQECIMRGEIYAPVNINTCTCIFNTCSVGSCFLYLFLEYIFSSSSGFITKTMHMWKETQKWYIMCVIC